MFWSVSRQLWHSTVLPRWRWPPPPCPPQRSRFRDWNPWSDSSHTRFPCTDQRISRFSVRKLRSSSFLLLLGFLRMHPPYALAHDISCCQRFDGAHNCRQLLKPAAGFRVDSHRRLRVHWSDSSFLKPYWKKLTT